MNRLNVTLVQSHIHWHDIEANLEHFGSLILSINRDNDLIVLPEMFTTGFTMTPAVLSEDMNGKTIVRMKEWSRSTGADVTGSIIVSENGHFFNRLIWVKPDGSVSYYDKRHLFRMAGEDKIYTRGEADPVIELKGWRIRTGICYDLRFPVWSRNINSGYDIFVYSANWPAARQEHWDILLRARAVENQCYVLGVNRTGNDGKGTAYTGGSAVTGFRGETLAHAGTESNVIHAVLERDTLMDYRDTFPVWMDGDRFTCL